MFKKAFTVIELLIVLAIIGLILAVMLAGFDLSRERARDNIRISAVNNVVLALEQYRSYCGNFPPELDIEALDQPQLCVNDADGQEALGNFISTIPKLPFDETYEYVTYHSGDPQKCTHFHIAVKLERDNAKELEEDSDKDDIAFDFCDTPGPDFNEPLQTADEDGWYDIFI